MTSSLRDARISDIITEDISHAIIIECCRSIKVAGYIKIATVFASFFHVTSLFLWVNEQYARSNGLMSFKTFIMLSHFYLFIKLLMWLSIYQNTNLSLHVCIFSVSFFVRLVVYSSRYLSFNKIGSLRNNVFANLARLTSL